MANDQPMGQPEAQAPDVQPMADVTRATGEAKPLFQGAHAELAGLWFHMRLKSLLDPTLDQVPARKCAYLASCFTGPAREWLIQKVTQETTLLSDYDFFERTVNEVFDLPEAVKKRQAEERMMHLKQNGGILAYVAEFETLATQLGWPSSAKRAMFYSGLQPNLREKLVVNNAYDTYSEMKDEAVRLGTALSADKGTSKKKRKKQAKCAKCGRTNHKTEDCYAKTTVQAISVKGASPVGELNRLDRITLQGRELDALVDTGSKIN